MLPTIAVIAVVGIGACVYLYVYHWRQRDYAEHKDDRQRIEPVKAYGVIDRVLKIYTPVLIVLCFLFDHPLLLEIHNLLWLRIAGLIVAGVGLALFLWSMRCLGDQFSPCDDAYMPSEIVRRGPYKRVRHPVYSSNLILMFGLFLASGSLWIVGNLIVMALFYHIAMSREETAMKERFAHYREYCETTGRLWPKL